MKLEYIILIILAIGFYNYSYKDYVKNKKNREFVKENLEKGINIITYDGIIGEIVDIRENEVIILSGNKDNNSYLNIDKEKIKSIIE